MHNTRIDANMHAHMRLWNAFCFRECQVTLLELELELDLSSTVWFGEHKRTEVQIGTPAVNTSCLEEKKKNSWGHWVLYKLFWRFSSASYILMRMKRVPVTGWYSSLFQLKWIRHERKESERTHNAMMDGSTDRQKKGVEIARINNEQCPWKEASLFGLDYGSPYY